MSLNDTPRANRLHIGIFGRRNAGKSSLINALTGQKLAIVSDTPGTTADPVFKSMELHPIGPVVFIDTAGFDDEGQLGQLRVGKTSEVVEKTDVAILVLDGTEVETCRREQEWIEKLQAAAAPVITVINKWELVEEKDREEILQAVQQAVQQAVGSDPAAAPDSAPVADSDPGPAAAPDSAPVAAPGPAPAVPVIPVSAVTGEGIDALRQAIAEVVPEEFRQERLLGGLASEGSLVLLVMPQDIQAPKGRLILPQVQTIRELLDERCTVIATTADGIDRALGSLKSTPDLIITDSQCFGMVYEKKPRESVLTSFSILMAASKGDISVFAEGVSAIDDALQEGDQAESFRVLIAEACTHVPLNEDIGTVKIPRLLRKMFADRVEITNVRGSDFPDIETLRQYDLIIHCGACMFNRRHVMSRISAAQQAGVPITNYGIFLAKMNGILDKVALPR